MLKMMNDHHTKVVHLRGNHNDGSEQNEKTMVSNFFGSKEKVAAYSAVQNADLGIRKIN